MSGFIHAMQGFAIIGLIIGVGYMCARFHIGGAQAQYVCNRMAFYVANPCLLFSAMSRQQLGDVFDLSIVVALGSAVTASALFIVVGHFALRLKPLDTAVGAFGSFYCNANNIGLPVATYILGNASLVAPLLLIQQGLFMPIVLATLDGLTSSRSSLKRALTSPLRQPMVIGTSLGIICSLISASVGSNIVPEVFSQTTSLIGGAAVPLVLMSFGMSIHGSKPMQQASHKAVYAVVAIKNVIMPVVAFLLAYFVLGFRGPVLYGCVVLAALPSAQNVFNVSYQYKASVPLARDSVLISTILSPISIAIIALLLS
ncbi:transporter, auxin efflux carrier (AEC) family protein [Bifidobacterium dolichotidis]|uniref:Transporter, auxin efflux carrier (AEC) family protein n=1 Tax=Bifidobacterium dolichotidis TaxID=2306976 RepID=A0A430FQF1_9BIFI|nr:AEC family transporter [Bifidobacterium dolichotidis]RSX55069.1 transporter, auxin efflux carrier (AEC) family protein [Bifidobacterium dolichotidis]